MLRANTFFEEEEDLLELSVVICTTPERKEQLASALLNVARQNYKPQEVIVVTDEGYSDYLTSSPP